MAKRRIDTGIMAPPIEAADLEGRHFSLAALRGQEAAVLVFLRGFF
jgi:peroxiredoxin